MSHKKFDPTRAEALISAERYHELKPDIMLQKLGIPPGSTILDLGCGNGFFTFPAAVAMGSGMVIAADMSEPMLSLLRQRNTPDNIQILQVEEVKMDIEDDSVDAAVLIALYHEFKTPLDNLTEIKRVLKTEGKLLILDWDPLSEKERGPAKAHRVEKKQAMNDLKAAGFSVTTDENYTHDMWMIIANCNT
ncbi:MAG: methyltransferase domain-containing protein [Candidatus Marinimicrobia bacterium]|jgi:ubiquinone/menaquinone biosynthesis C-methylase UbiE|nr:methyltransferase domain-containing protein [Candidatus Neomarinimicrobiota bacterium]MBT3632124.1 methyltransferase domain-containing protein [Candidatus Neomarinimicrobiota bacterium]MBT3824213.1 methyltransferase domain-containing protein [Candidatus Neomarinimicrobiota bacterium]MBT4129705.1 methyltransferase domain-containing protein [Candidatus Neomarinimicrobiota bacterium]MBT4294722.1 methyltransferase domain-containing protein [Candidatus Neomarinimicrobiota bacterium]